MLLVWAHQVNHLNITKLITQAQLFPWHGVDQFMMVEHWSQDTLLRQRKLVKMNGQYALHQPVCKQLTSPAPVNFEIKDVKRDYVQLQWEPPQIDGGARITHYIVEKRESKRLAFTTVTNSCVRNSFKVDDLQEGGLYHFRVLAVNELGVGLPAETIEAVKVSQAPLPPGKITVVDVTRHTVTLAWEKPDHDGGSKITGYTVEMMTKGSDKWTVCATVKALETTIEGLTTGEEYSFRITAVNDKGKSDSKPLGASVVARDITIEPIVDLLFNTYSVKAGDDLKIDVPFRGRPLPEVTWKKDGHSLKQTTRVNVLTSKTSSKIVIKDSTREDAGKYEIILTNSIGIKSNAAGLLSEPSEGTGPVTVKDDVDPPRITIEDKLRQLVVVKAGDILRIDAEISGRPIPVTSWAKDGKEIEAKARFEISSTLTSTTIIVRDAIRRDSGQYVLTLQNVAGTRSLAVNCKVLDRPGPSAGPLEVTGLTAEKCTLNWGPPQENGGAEIQHYIVEKRETSRLAWTLVYADMKATTCKATKLLKGNEYIFRVRGVNKYGTGEALESDPVKAMDPFTIPAAPTNVDVTSVTSEAMTICWERPVSDGGSSISGYVIEKREKSGLRWVRVNKKPVYDLRVKASNLREGCEYEYRVFAENAAGLSAPSLSTSLESGLRIVLASVTTLIHQLLQSVFHT
uniref:Titin n=1 Tax=Sinocyclocheilus grahami TaxID=75366 RepID=A0A672NWE4_SINGR